MSAYDDPDIHRDQLSRLNSFANCGDLVVFGAPKNGTQLHPFLLAKTERGLDTARVTGAHELDPLLCDLRDALAT